MYGHFAATLLSSMIIDDARVLMGFNGTTITPPGIHRYWRLRVTSTTIGDYTAMTAFRGMSSLGGSDLFQGKTVSASVIHSSTYNADKAVDNDSGTFWTTGAAAMPGGGHWFLVDLGSGNDAEILFFDITSRIDGVREDPRTFHLEYSDNGTTFTIANSFSTGAWGAAETRSFSVASVDGQANTLDESGYDWPVFLYNSATIDDTQSKFGGAALYCDANTQVAYIPWNPDFNFGSADFTVEYFVRPAYLGTTYEHLAGCRASAVGGSISWAMTLLPDHKLEVIWRASTGTEYYLNTASAFSTATWYHIAFVRDGNTLKLFVDGDLKDSEDITANPVFRDDYRYPITIGTMMNGGHEFRGWIDEFRISPGVAKYTGNFTIPSAPFIRADPVAYPEGADPYWANVKLLAGFEGANGATSYTEESTSARVATFGGTTSISTSLPTIGSGTGSLLAANSSYVSFPDSDDWAFGSSSFTVEAWVYPVNWTTGHIIGQRPGGGSGGSNVTWAMTLLSDGRLECMLNDGATMTQLATSGILVWTKTWTHVCLESDGTKARLYVNGTVGASQTSPASVQNLATPLTIGGAASGGLLCNMYIDEVRITVGVARYANDAGFIPPHRGLLRGS